MQLKIYEINHFVHVFDLVEKCAPLDSHLRHYPHCFGVNPELCERTLGSASRVLDSQRRRVEFENDESLVICSLSSDVDWRKSWIHFANRSDPDRNRL